MCPAPVRPPSSRAWVRYEVWLAARILRARKRRSVSIVTAISVTGIVIGVMALTVVSGITDGFSTALRQRILGLYPHLLVIARAGDFQQWREAMERVRQAPHVVGVSPATYNEMLAALGPRRAGVAVKGIDPETVRSVSRIEEALVAGRLDALDERPRLQVTPGALVVADATEGTRHVVALLPRRQIVVARYFPARPLPGEATVVLAHLAPAGGRLALRVAGAEAARTSAVAAGHTTEALALAAGDHALQIVDEDGLVVATVPWRAQAGQVALVAVLDGAQGAPRAQLVAGLDEPWRRLPPGEAVLWLLDGRTEGPALPVRDAGGRVLASAALAPGGQLGPVRVSGRAARVLLGERLRRRLDADLGDLVTFVSPLRGVDNAMIGPAGMAPTSARYEVAGWFRSGYFEYDNRLALVHLHAAQRFLHRGDVVQWLDVRFDDDLQVARRTAGVRRTLEPYALSDLASALGRLRQRIARIAAGDVASPRLHRPPRDTFESLDNIVSTWRVLSRGRLDLGAPRRYKYIDWEQMNHNLLSALKLQKVVLTVFFLIIIVVAAFNVVGSQVMTIHDKRADIAILKAMGASSRSVLRIFLLHGLLVSAAGTAVGLVLGLGAGWVLDRIGYPLDPKVYLIDRLPVQMDVSEAFLVALAALVVTCATTTYSARRAAQLLPVQGIRQID